MVNSWCGFTSIMPLLVAPIADAYWHKYSTIMASSFLYLMIFIISVNESPTTVPSISDASIPSQKWQNHHRRTTRHSGGEMALLDGALEAGANVAVDTKDVTLVIAGTVIRGERGNRILPNGSQESGQKAALKYEVRAVVTKCWRLRMIGSIVEKMDRLRRLN
ncbi:hypothetical protein S83_056365 [Arachis hypogaea]